MSELWNEVYRYGSAGLTEDVVDELLKIIEEHDARTAAPRFTAEEREAIETVCRNYAGEYGYDLARKKAIAVIYAMIEGKEAGE